MLGGRECNADLRSWIDRFGSIGHGENSYDHWVSLGKPRDGADQPSLLQGWYRKGFEDSLLRLERSSVHEWTAKRQRLIRFIWGEAGFPAEKTPDAVEKGISDRRYTSIENLASIDRIEVRMEFGAQSIIYLFHPRSSNSRLLIYHQGHGGGFILGVDTIQFFVRHGYTVAAFSMPMLGMNGPLVIETPDGSITLRKHPDLGSLESEVFSPLKFFVEPLIVFLNYAMAEYAYDTAAMVGISGGGWTTTLAAALEPRIVRSYPVAGSLPLVFGAGGDWEQTHHSLYETANYMELYVLGTYGHGRRQIQVLNRYDWCCFGGTEYVLYEEHVSRTAERVSNGSFSVFVDETHRDHKLSEAALDVILKDLERP